MEDPRRFKILIDRNLDRIRKEIKNLELISSIFVTLNKDHMEALNKFLSNSQDVSAKRNVLDILSRENDIINRCISEVEIYEKTLKKLKSKSIGLLTQVYIDNLHFILTVTAIIQKKLSDLRYRNQVEQRDILKQNPNQIKGLINDLKKEKEDFKKMIKQSSIQKLIRLRGDFLECSHTTSWARLEYVLVGDPTKYGYTSGGEYLGNLTRFSPINNLFLTIALIIDSLLKLLCGFAEDDEQLKKLIEILESQTKKVTIPFFIRKIFNG